LQTKSSGLSYQSITEEEIASVKAFLFEEIGQDAMKIMSIPICFRWVTNGDTKEVLSEAGKTGVKLIVDGR